MDASTALAALAHAVGDIAAASRSRMSPESCYMSPPWARHAHMSELRREAYGPTGDAAHHRAGEVLDDGLRALPPAPRDRGRLILIVCRGADGVRDARERACLTCEDGVLGDG